MIHLTLSTKNIKNFSGVLVAGIIAFASLGAPLLTASVVSADDPNSMCQDTPVPSSDLDAPMLLTPSNSSTNPNGFDFSWASVNGAAQYDWESSLITATGADGSFDSRLGYHRLSNTSLNEAHSPEGTYYWHVRAVGSDGTLGPWSQIWKSTISNSQLSYLGAPSLTFPGNGATCNIHSQDFYFSWQAPLTDGGTSPLTYVFQSSQSTTTDTDTGNFTGQSWTTSNLGTSVFDGGSPNGTYYWHVRAVGSDGTLGPWSATWQVNITREAPPVTPPVVTPVTPETNNPTASSPSDQAPATTASYTTTTSTHNPIVPAIFIPASADIASVIGANNENAPTQSIGKNPHKANLAAGVAKVNDSNLGRNVAWVLALFLAVAGVVFAFRRFQNNEE